MKIIKEKVEHIILLTGIIIALLITKDKEFGLIVSLSIIVSHIVNWGIDRYINIKEG